ncbi:hypothetical protein Mal64_38670 [Pseudobythopirellula maris]|uniref:Glycosyl hydrolase family 65 central catalytic domain protein n=2 Tax=Pseudobythopirellula maris TaxID=2527991 RepID=A0A5C5ZGH7_9BACT|nr:hypothetical protein Mal64_38670 [Pseudobythopirellula maris]
MPTPAQETLRARPVLRPAALLACFLALVMPAAAPAAAEAPIDRQAVVSRHDPTHDRLAPEAPLSVGNGGFAFTFDATGLQTFPGDGGKNLPLVTMSDRHWHTFPNPQGYTYEQTLSDYEVEGRSVSYSDGQNGDAGQHIRRNPHRMSLAQIGLVLRKENGDRAAEGDLSEINQRLTLWAGEATSRFTFRGQTVEVQTVGDPQRDAVAVRVTSPLVASGDVGVELRFSYPTGEWGYPVQSFDQPERHSTKMFQTPGRAVFVRTLDGDGYWVDARLGDGAQIEQVAAHHAVVTQPGSDVLELVVDFPATGPAPTDLDDDNRDDNRDNGATPLSFASLRDASAKHWEAFWRSGAAVDLSESQDPRWRELERRVVLSQYLTAIQCAGPMPPQETGLTTNSWHGKGHLEMHPWHAAQFALWDRSEMLTPSLAWYEEILPAARAIAERQGYAGVRWPKMTGPHGVSSPSGVGEFLIWQQPHPILFADLVYRADPSHETLERYSELVVETADFMADIAVWDEEGQRYVLGPPLIPAQECYPRRSTMNPTFELVYWRWALQTAAEWSERLGRKPNPAWREVASKIAQPTVMDGYYAAVESAPLLNRHDHPSMLCALGVMPKSDLIDTATMSRTLDTVLEDWDWPTTWGWDFPVMAMTAARLDRPEDAVDCLLMDAPKNVYLANGHNYQTERLPLYLPGNGGVLWAVAQMAGGWEGAPDRPAPGFPAAPAWVVRHEGFIESP